MINLSHNVNQRQKIYQLCRKFNIQEKRSKNKTQNQYFRQSFNRLIDHLISKVSSPKQIDTCRDIIKKKILELNENKKITESMNNYTLRQIVDKLMVMIQMKMKDSPKKQEKNLQAGNVQWNKLLKEKKILQEKINLLRQDKNMDKYYDSLIKLMEIQSIQQLQADMKKDRTKRQFLDSLIIQLSDIQNWDKIKDQLHIKLSRYQQQIQKNLNILYKCVDKQRNHCLDETTSVKQPINTLINNLKPQKENIVLVQEWNKEREGYLSQILLFQNEKRELQQLKTIYEQQFVNGEKVLGELNEKIQQLQLQNTEYKKQIFKMKKMDKSTQNTIKKPSKQQEQINGKMKVKMQEYQRQISCLNTIIAKMNKAKQNPQKSSKDFTKQQYIIALREEIVELKASLQNFTQKNATYQNQSKFLNTTIQRLNGQIDQIKRINAVNQEKCNQSTKVIQNLRKNERLLNANHMRLKAQKNEIDEKGKFQREEHVRIKRDNIQLSQKIYQMEQQINSIQKALKQHQKRYLQRCQETQLKENHKKQKVLSQSLDQMKT